MRSIIIIGANGRLGAALTREYQRPFSVKAFARNQLDLGKLDQVRSTLSEIEFDLLINCAALTNVDYCESHRDEAFLINAQGPRLLADICAEKSARLIHISTDYVFDGKQDTLYRGGSTGSIERLCRIETGRRRRGARGFSKESRGPAFLGLRAG